MPPTQASFFEAQEDALEKSRGAKEESSELRDFFGDVNVREAEPQRGEQQTSKPVE